MSKYVYSYSYGKEIYSFQSESLQTVLEELLELYVDDGSIKSLSVTPEVDGVGFDVKVELEDDLIEAVVPNDASMVEEFVYLFMIDGQHRYNFSVVEVV